MSINLAKKSLKYENFVSIHSVMNINQYYVTLV